MMKWMKAALLALGLVLFASAACAENTVQYVTREGKIHTIYWMEGITPPAMPNQTPAGKPSAGTFKLINEQGDIVTDPAANTLRHEYYVSEYMPGNDWYDTNKEFGSAHGKDDTKFGYAVAASNLIHWWLDQNGDNVQKYLALDPMPQNHKGLAKLETLESSGYLDPVPDQAPQNAPIYALYRRVCAANYSGYPDHAMDLFINGFDLSNNKNLPNTMDQFFPQSQAGFFYPVFDLDTLTDRIVDFSYSNLSGELKAHILNGYGMAFTYATPELQRRTLTLWGAEYDEQNKLTALFVTDPDDVQNPFYENGTTKQASMIRFDVYPDEYGYTRASTMKHPAKGDGAFVETQFVLSLGRARWAEFFQTKKPSGKPFKPTKEGADHAHELQYSVDGLKIVQTCKNCNMYLWVTLNEKEKPRYTYNGKEQEPYDYASCGEGWQDDATKFVPEVRYSSNHADAGVVKVTMSYKGAVVEHYFQIDKAVQNPPNAPTAKEKTGTSVTLYAEANQEYSMDGVNWKRSSTDSITFDGLKPDTTYSFYTRCAEDKNHGVSKSSPAASVKTNQEFFIRFMLNGSDTVIPEQMTKNQKLENGLPVPAGRIGHAFLGWFDAPDGGAKAENDRVYQSNTTLYARWEALPYTLTFDTAGGSAVETITAVMDTPITPPADPTKVGYTFAGWEPEFPSAMPPANKTFTAKWQINSYTLTFDTDGGTGIAPITQNFGTDITPPENPTKGGCTFAGWEPELPQTMPAGNLTVKAKWTVNKYMLTFNTDGGSQIAPIMQNFGTDITPPENPTKDGFVFAGWVPELPAVMPAGNLTVKAKWTANAYTLTFDTDGGSQIAPIMQEFGTAITPPTNPTKEGFVFVGWEPELPANMPAENLTVKAKWSGQELKLEALSTVPKELENTPFNTVEKIQKELEKTAAKLLPAGQTTGKAFYNLVLYVYDSKGEKRPATREEIEKNGSITTLIPYPAGTSGKTHDFVVAHMITVSVNGMKPGDVETPAPIERTDGLEVRFSGLSPVIVQYTEIKPPAELPKTGDDSRLTLMLSCGALALGAALVVVKKKKK